MMKIEKKRIEQLLLELIQGQEKVVADVGRRIRPTLTSEDLLQPNDYPELEGNADFRFEEGLLMGLQAALSAIRASGSV